MSKKIFIARHFFDQISISTNSIWQNRIVPKIVEIQQQRKHNRKYKYTENYLAEVIKQMEKNPTSTNIDLIYDLEHIADINPRLHWIIMNILINFIRDNHFSTNRKENFSTNRKEIPTNSSEKISPLIQAAINVIARRDATKDPENEQIDLSYIDLRGINLQEANLEQINLYQANLSGANLANANLAKSILSAANLEGANLTNANLSGAILSAANLDKANLLGANLQKANLYLASLQGTILNDAILEGANLREAKLKI